MQFDSFASGLFKDQSCFPSWLFCKKMRNSIKLRVKNHYNIYETPGIELIFLNRFLFYESFQYPIVTIEYLLL